MPNVDCASNVVESALSFIVIAAQWAPVWVLAGLIIFFIFEPPHRTWRG